MSESNEKNSQNEGKMAEYNFFSSGGNPKPDEVVKPGLSSDLCGKQTGYTKQEVASDANTNTATGAAVFSGGNPKPDDEVVKPGLSAELD